MKIRVIKKRAKRLVGHCRRCGAPIYNWVSRNDYAGSCLQCNEDMYACEIVGYKKAGRPIVAMFKNEKVLNPIFKLEEGQ